MDIEWAKDGITGEIFIVQARPETVQALKTQYLRRIYFKTKRKIIINRYCYWY